MIACILIFMSLTISQAPVLPVVEHDRLEVVLPVEFQQLLHKANASGRMKIFLNSTRSQNRADPADGPFFQDPQPM